MNNALSAAEVAALLQIPKRTILSWIRQGIIKARKVGNSFVIDERSLKGYEKRLRPRGNPKHNYQGPFKVVLLVSEKDRLIKQEFGQYDHFTVAQRAARKLPRVYPQIIAVLDERDREIWSAGAPGKKRNRT